MQANHILPTGTITTVVSKNSSHGGDKQETPEKSCMAGHGREPLQYDGGRGFAARVQVKFVDIHGQMSGPEQEDEAAEHEPIGDL